MADENEKKKIRVQIYDYDKSIPLSSVIANARRPFDLAGYESEWIDALSAPKELLPVKPYGNLGIRLVKGKAPQHSAAGFTGGMGSTIGSVYPDMLRQDYSKTILDKAIGSATAHELGHMLFGTHTRKGIMRPGFTPSEIIRNNPQDWSFIND